MSDQMSFDEMSQEFFKYHGTEETQQKAYDYITEAGVHHPDRNISPGKGYIDTGSCSCQGQDRDRAQDSVGKGGSTHILSVAGSIAEASSRRATPMSPSGHRPRSCRQGNQSSTQGRSAS